MTKSFDFSALLDTKDRKGASFARPREVKHDRY